jgi:hypothetical protein
MYILGYGEVIYLGVTDSSWTRADYSFGQIVNLKNYAISKISSFRPQTSQWVSIGYSLSLKWDFFERGHQQYCFGSNPRISKPSRSTFVCKCYSRASLHGLSAVQYLERPLFRRAATLVLWAFELRSGPLKFRARRANLPNPGVSLNSG